MGERDFKTCYYFSRSTGNITRQGTRYSRDMTDCEVLFFVQQKNKKNVFIQNKRGFLKRRRDANALINIKFRNENFAYTMARGKKKARLISILICWYQSKNKLPSSFAKLTLHALFNWIAIYLEKFFFCLTAEIFWWFWEKVRKLWG